MRFTTKLSRLFSVLSVLLLFVFLCSFAASGLRVAEAESHSGVGSQVQEGKKQERDEHHEHEDDHDDHEHDDHEHGDHEDDDHEHGDDEDDDDEDDDDEDDDDEDDDEDEHHHHELEEHMMDLEIHAREIELELREVEAQVMEIEMMKQIFEVVDDAEKTSFFAIMKIDDMMDEQEAVETLDQCLKDTTNGTIKRAIRMKLIELKSEMDDSEAAGEHLRALILAE